ncbi:MAG: ribosome recycling factor [Nitrospira sp.]|nr:ribosome recycling factor [Nitrospira sp.]
MSNAAVVRQNLTTHMEQAVEHLKRDLAGLRTGRASVALLDGVRVDYYGTMTPLKQVSNISTPEARLITIQPWEPQLIKEIEKSLANSGLGVTPSNDGKMIRVPLPPLTEERRKELTKICKKHGEDTKVQIRGFRRDANEELKKLQKDTKLTEDELRKAEQDTQKLTDQFGQKIDDVIKRKEQEIMEV